MSYLAVEKNMCISLMGLTTSQLFKRAYRPINIAYPLKKEITPINSHESLLANFHSQCFMNYFHTLKTQPITYAYKASYQNNIHPLN